MKPLRLLLVEDSDVDEALILRALRKGGFDPMHTRVADQAAFQRALEPGRWDLIISDYTMPGYSGLLALRDAREFGLDVPFILVSGSIGEVVAVDIMRQGAQDYVLKDQLTRLPAAVERELTEAVGRADRRRMREQLVISERMASAGMLAAGVAHEINNPLAVLFVNLEYVADTIAKLVPEARKLAPGADPAAWLEGRLAAIAEPMIDARESVVRIRDIVRDVKVFSRPDEAKRGPIDVRRVIDSTLRLAWNEIRHRAQLVKDLQDVPLVEANEGHLGQVLLNLVVNAAQAMPEGHAEANEIKVTTRTDGDRAVIEVKDSGCGIPKEKLGRIFDPFYTTKPVGVGTGLGLAICYRLVKEFGGDIEVESEVGKGTTMRVSCPAAVDHAAVEAAAAAARAAEQAAAPRRARVLVVDDEPSIVRLLERTLGEFHEVVTLTSGREALARLSAGERFDAILADLMMPEVSGMELHEALREAAPDQAARMIFVTGGAFTPRARTFLEKVENPRVDKPFTVPDLLAIIDGFLGRRPSS